MTEAEAEVVYGESEHDLDQGDVLEDVPFLVRLPGRVETRSMLGLVVSHGCDIEKYERQLARLGPHNELLQTWPVTVAPLHSPELLVGGQAGDAFAGRIHRYFAIPAANGFEPLVADLWHSQPVPLVNVMELERRASLCERYCRRLQVAIATLYSRADLRKLGAWAVAE